VRFFYAYRIQSKEDPNHHYTGFTENLQQRVAEHNQGKVPMTAGWGPWTILSAHAFTEKSKALAFEQYLKSGSGREFALRHF
jgi:predicted GIY-YIG superfamily endonuclease